MPEIAKKELLGFPIIEINLDDEVPDVGQIIFGDWEDFIRLFLEASAWTVDDEIMKDCESDG